jgi:hypothetical protein
MVFNATFNNISVISWLSVVLVEKTGVFGDNVTCHKSKMKCIKTNLIKSFLGIGGLSRFYLYCLGSDILCSCFQNVILLSL